MLSEPHLFCSFGFLEQCSFHNTAKTRALLLLIQNQKMLRIEAPKNPVKSDSYRPCSPVSTKVVHYWGIDPPMCQHAHDVQHLVTHLCTSLQRISLKAEGHQQHGASVGALRMLYEILLSCRQRQHVLAGHGQRHGNTKF